MSERAYFFIRGIIAIRASHVRFPAVLRTSRRLTFVRNFVVAYTFYDGSILLPAFAQALYRAVFAAFLQRVGIRKRMLVPIRYNAAIGANTILCVIVFLSSAFHVRAAFYAAHYAVYQTCHVASRDAERQATGHRQQQHFQYLLHEKPPKKYIILMNYVVTPQFHCNTFFIPRQGFYN